MKAPTASILTENPGCVSRRRFVGAVLFGLVLAGYVQNAVDYTMPRIIAYTHSIELEDAKGMFEQMPWRLVDLMAAFVTGWAGAIGATYVARARHRIASLLAASLFVLLPASLAVLAVILPGRMGAERARTEFWIHTLSALVCVFGWRLGMRAGCNLAEEWQHLEGPNTVLGIKWGHFLWILPFVYFPWLASLVVVPYLIGGLLASDLSNLRLDPSSLLLGPDLSTLLRPNAIKHGICGMLLIVVILVVVLGMSKFMEAMHHTRTSGRLVPILIYGVASPNLAWIIGFYAARVIDLRAIRGESIIVACLLVGFLLLLIPASKLAHRD